MTLQQETQALEDIQQKLATELEESERNSLTLSEDRLPVKPKKLTPAEDSNLKERAIRMVRQLAEADGVQEMELSDSMTSLGVRAQRKAGSELELLRTKVGSMLSGDKKETEIFHNLVELRQTLNQVNPGDAGSASLVRKTVSMVPFVGNPAIKAIGKIAIRYEPLSKQASVIECRLRDGRAMLMRDNAELRQLYQQVEEQQTSVQKNAYLGELLIEQLDKLLEETPDPIKQEQIRDVLHAVTTRTQDLRAMDEVNGQFFLTIRMTRQNNLRLAESVERTLAIASNVVLVGLAIQMAMVRQKQIQEAARRTQEFLGEMIAANASALSRHTEEIGDIYNRPVIAMDKINQAHNSLLEAMDRADRLKLEGIKSARENIGELNRLSEETRRRGLGLRGMEDTKSLEAERY